MKWTQRTFREKEALLRKLVELLTSERACPVSLKTVDIAVCESYQGIAQCDFNDEYATVGLKINEGVFCEKQQLLRVLLHEVTHMYTRPLLHAHLAMGHPPHTEESGTLLDETVACVSETLSWTVFVNAAEIDKLLDKLVEK